MHTRLVVLVGVLFLAVTMMASAGSDHAKKIVGVWEMTKGDRIGTRYEFTKDGKIKVTDKAGKEQPLEVSYKIKGDDLLLEVKMADKTEMETVTIKKLTDQLLVIIDKMKEVEFKRVK